MRSAARFLEAARLRWRASRPGAWAAAYFGVIADRASGWRRRSAYVLAGLAAIFAAGLGLLLVYALALIPFTPSTEELKRAKSEKPTVVLSGDGKELASYKRLNREWVKLAAISRPVIDALIATEDHRFYEHRGVDVRRTVASVFYTLTGDLQGGSTITQQLARNLYPDRIGRSASVTRKVKEIVTALKIESVLTKDEILETYLNTVPFLYNAVGIEMAARTYFGKSAGALNVLESATLVGMLKGTSYYNPVLNPERAVARRNLVLGQMALRGKVKPESLEALRKRPLRVAFQRQTEPIGPAPHFAEHLRKWLIGWADRNGYNIYADGLVVFTTLDSRLQALANRAVARQLEALQAVADVEWATPSAAVMSTDIGAYAQRRPRVEPFAHFWKSNPALVDTFIQESAAWRADDGLADAERLARLRSDAKFMGGLREDKTRLQAGFMALDPRDGHVKAWVGSRDFKEDQFDHVIRAQRQPGSTFKPFVYAAALEQGMSPSLSFYDRPVEIALGGGAVWRPTDADAPSGEPMTLRDGLVFSRNTITAQVMQRVGPAKVAALARDMGARQSKLQAVPSLALGTSPVTLSEMVSGYATIANGGTFIEPILVTRIEDGNGNVLEAFVAAAPEPVLHGGTAKTLFDIMRGVIDEGTGTGIRRLFGIQADVAGKTGTTQDNTDGWFILMHRQLVAGAWVGFNDNRVTMRSAYWGQGAHNALYVVGDFYRQVISARLIEPGVARPPRQEPERRAENVIERFGNLIGRIFDRSPGPRPPAWERRRPQLQPDEEVFYERRESRRERRQRGGPRFDGDDD